MHVDVHQHIWTAPLLEALAARDALPLIRRTDGQTVLRCANERPYVIDEAAEAPGRRAGLVREDGLDLALISLSSPVGIEALPRESAVELIDAHLRGVDGLPPEFAFWGPVALDRADPNDVDAVLGRRCVGISLPAAAISSPDRLDRLGPILERTAARGVPLFVHPGPAIDRPSAEAPPEEPPWWRALTDYVAQMHAAWLTFVALGRREHPELTVVFAMLAGCAPLQAERLATRGGPALELRDPRLFYDTSSYGPGTIETMAHHVGLDQLLYGSDRPVIEPASTARDALLQANGAKLLTRIGARA